MTTVLQARSRGFVNTPSIERLAARALRYLQSGFSVHLRGPAGTGKTTLAMHLADLLSRPIMLVFGDDEFKSSDLIGNQTGYTRKKVVDNYIHSVVKLEDELRHNWVDSRLTMACREGFTLVYDEFNRSRPEVNNVLLSALEEKLLVLPPSSQRHEYIRVNSHFRAILTSNPEEYCGVHETQDALMDRLITINVPEPDELTQQEILAQKIGLPRSSALPIVRLVKTFRIQAKTEKSSGLRSCLMIGKICHEHHIAVNPSNVDFRDVCADILLSRTGLPIHESTPLLWQLLNDGVMGVISGDDTDGDGPSPKPVGIVQASQEPVEGNLTLVEVDEETPEEEETLRETLGLEDLQDLGSARSELDPLASADALTPDLTLTPQERKVYDYLQSVQVARVATIEKATTLSRVETVDALKSLVDRRLLEKQQSDVGVESSRTMYCIKLASKLEGVRGLPPHLPKVSDLNSDLTEDLAS